MTKSKYVSDIIKILYTADRITSPCGDIVLTDDLRVELCQRMNSAVKKYAKEEYEKKYPAGNAQIDAFAEKKKK